MGDITSFRRPKAEKETFLTRLRKRVQDYNITTDKDASLARCFIRDSQINLPALAVMIGVSEARMQEIAAGTGLIPDMEMRGTMKYCIINELTRQITEKNKPPH